uniref:Uncharacterized protein n=1 Tax=Arundo donax TaxID=35708 RepID=A0A0A9H425_ARUDO
MMDGMTEADCGDFESYVLSELFTYFWCILTPIPTTQNLCGSCGYVQTGLVLRSKSQV